MKFFFISLSILFVLSVNNTYASHASGGSLSYTCLGSDQYLVTMRLLRDCSGSPLPGTLPLLIRSQSCGISPYQISMMSLQSEYQASSCPKFNGGTTCDPTGTRAGYDIGVYQTIVNIPSPCTDWVLYTQLDARNSSSIVNSATLRIEAGLNNTSGICNNSPYFDNDFVFRVCPNISTNISYSFWENDGDIVVGEFMCPLQPDPGYSPQLLAPTVDASFDGLANCSMPFPSTTGNWSQSGNIMSFTPSIQGISSTAYKLSEYNSSGQLVGWVMMEVQIVSEPENCINIEPNIGPILGSNGGSNSFNMLQGATECFQIPVTEQELENITTNVVFDNLPGATYSILGNGPTQIIEICFSDPTYDCISNDYYFTIYSTDDGCPSPAGSSKQFTVNVDPGLFCNEYLYITDRNSQVVPLPPVNQASNTIYVGDDMPIGFSGTEGPVELDYDVHFKAQVAINLGPCASGSNGGLVYGDCIILNGNSINLEIRPNICSPNCPNDPIVVSVQEYFECNGEKLIADVSGGVGPYVYQWTVGTQTWSTGTDNTASIHHIASAQNGGDVDYILNVYDANGNIGSVSGAVLGTKRFYQDIHNNTTDFTGQYITCPNDANTSSPCQLFHSNLVVCGNPNCNSNFPNGYPFEIWDNVNSGPPYYGGTWYEFEVWGMISGSLGIAYSSERNLEGGTDWSLENHEISWNGYWNNDINDNCMGDGIYEYRLKMKNCLGNTDFYFEIWDLEMLECYDGTYHPNITYGMIEVDSSTSNQFAYATFSQERKEKVENSLAKDGVEKITKGNYTVFPNPSNKEIKIQGNIHIIESIIIYDLKGRIVQQIGKYMGNFHNVENLENGKYIIEIRTKNSVERLGLVKI